MMLPARCRALLVGRNRGTMGGRRVDARRARTPPGVQDRRPHRATLAVPYELLPCTPDLAHARCGRCARVNGDPWVGRHRFLAPRLRLRPGFAKRTSGTP